MDKQWLLRKFGLILLNYGQTTIIKQIWAKDQAHCYRGTSDYLRDHLPFPSITFLIILLWPLKSAIKTESPSCALLN